MGVVRSVFVILAFALLAEAQNGGSSLSGRVVNSVTRAGIAGAEIRMCRSGSPTPGVAICRFDELPTAVSDETGTYRLTGLADGQYMFLPLPREGFFPVMPAKPQINVSGDTHLDVELIPLAGVRGRVLDPDGKPAAGVVVALDAPSCRGCTAMDVSITNADGEYSFTGLPPVESLILSASPRAQDPKAEEKIVTTYYPSAIDRDLAEGVRSQGIDLFGYDIKLRTAQARSVKGIVIDNAGKPVPKAIVSIVKPATGMVAMIRGYFAAEPIEVPVAEPSQTRDDGTFTFPSVRRGNWTLRAALGDPALSGSADVSVSDAEVENVQVRVAPPLDIELQTDWGDSPPARFPAGPATFIPLDSPLLLPPLPGDLGPGQAPQFVGFAGKYLIGPGPSPQPGFYLAAVLLDNRDVLGQVADIASGDSLKLIFKTGGGSVRGTVEKGAEATVVLMADASASARIGYATRCDSNGAFVLRDLPPGEYTAVAVQGAVGDPARPEFSAMLSASGRRVRVEAGSAAQVDLRVAR